METETHLWRCIEDHANQQRGMFQERVKPADIARATGISEQLLSKWRRKPTLPNPAQLAAIRDGLKVPYHAMLEAALTDRGWLPEPPAGSAPAVHPDIVAAASRHTKSTPRKRGKRAG